MDPNENLRQQLAISTRILQQEALPDVEQSPDVVRLAELVIALNEWMEKGGFCPARWGVR